MKETLIDFYKKECPYPIKDQFRQKDDRSNICYLIYNDITKNCKIGVTKNLKERIRSLETSSGIMLTHLISIWLQVDYDESSSIIEDAIKKYFKPKQVLGEWYKLSIRDVIMIKDLFWMIEGEDIQDDIKEVYENLKKVA